MKIKTIGLDLAKSVFQAHGVDANGETVLLRQTRVIQCALRARHLYQGPRRRISIKASGQQRTAQPGRTYESHRSTHTKISPCHRGRPHMNHIIASLGIPQDSIRLESALPAGDIGRLLVSSSPPTSPASV